MFHLPKLRVTKKIIESLPKDIFDDTILIAIQHLLRDTLVFFLLLKRRFNFYKIVVLGKDYSSRLEVVQRLNKEGIFANVYSNDELDDHRFICKNLSTFYNECKRNKIKYLILEDGGYIVPALHKGCPRLLDFCLGAVEQTKTGYWRDKKIEKLKIPIISIASSTLKQIAESPEVGNAIARNLDIFLTKINCSLSQRNVGVLGYGWIGRNVAIALANRGAKVLIYDENAIQMIRAQIDARDYNFKIENRETVLKLAEIIIGATGNPLSKLKAKDFKDLKNNVILANATSKQIEFDIPYLEKNAREIKRISSKITKYIMKNGKTIVVLNNGYPINFAVGESVPGPIIDIIIAEMLVCLKKLKTEKLKNKIYEISEEEEREIANEWLKLYT